MKRFYIDKTSVISAFLLVVLMAACGMIVDKVELSSDNVEQNGTVTITTTYKQHDNQENNKGIYLFYGVRVPEDWSNEGVVKGLNTYNDGKDETEFEFTESEAYGKLLDMCYPREGYKWLTFESVKQYDVECNGSLVANLTLRAGEKMGDYHLDVISGVMRGKPSDLLNSDGSVNLDVAFGHKIDGGASEKKDVNGQPTYSVSEYLMLATTITPEERDKRSTSLLDKSVTVDGVTLPLSPVDIGNALDANKIKQLNLDVTVTKSTGIENVNAEDAVDVIVGEGCVYVSAETGEAMVYNVAGMMIDSQKVNGETVLKAQKGANIVVFTNGGKRTVHKVIVK